MNSSECRLRLVCTLYCCLFAVYLRLSGVLFVVCCPSARNCSPLPLCTFPVVESWGGSSPAECVGWCSREERCVLCVWCIPVWLLFAFLTVLPLSLPAFCCFVFLRMLRNCRLASKIHNNFTDNKWMQWSLGCRS